jgi:hypothetical protein
MTELEPEIPALICFSELIRIYGESCELYSQPALQPPTGARWFELMLHFRHVLSPKAIYTWSVDAFHQNDTPWHPHLPKSATKEKHAASQRQPGFQLC